MIYNAVSTKAIIGKVYRDLGLEDPSFELDAIEWMGEALDWIGAGIQMTDKEVWEVVTNHTATLPSDLEYLTGVWFVNDAPLKNNWQSKEFPYDLNAIEDKQKYKLERSDEQLHEGIGGDSTNLQNSTFYDGEDYTTSFQDLQGSGSGESTNFIGYDSPESYHLNGNELKTTFDRGLVLVAYRGLPLDEDGYPLVPDDVAYKEALFWYIAKKLSIVRQDQVPFDYKLAEQKWLKRCTQARNRANMPDLDEYEKFLQSWTKMVETERFNKTRFFQGQSDPRDGKDLGPTGDYRVTESGVIRVTEDGDTRYIESN